ncbi:MAG: translocation/assembly module TamB domain-containing protein [Rhodanobacteraceae bacterium]
MGSGFKKWLKRTGMAIAAVMLVLALALWWLLGTGSGMQFALDRVVAATHGAVTVKRASGTLAGPLHVEGLRYRASGGTEVAVNDASVDVSVWPLLRRTLHIHSLRATGIRITLAQSAEAAPGQSSSFSLAPPISMVLDDARLRGLEVRQAGKAQFAADSIDLGGGWTNDGIRIEKLRLRSPDGHADAHGRLLLGTRYRGRGTLEFSWQLDSRRFAGTLNTSSDGNTARARLALTQPMVASIHLQMKQHKDYPWQLDAKLPRGDAAPLVGTGGLKTLAADLHASGTRHSGKLEGSLHLNDWPLSIRPLQVALSADGNSLQIQSMKLASARVPGSMQVHGEIALDGKPVAARLDVQWQDIELPAELAGQRLASHGQLALHGSIDDYRATGEIHAGPPGRLTDMKLDIQGNDRQLNIRSWVLKQPQGSARVAGTITFQPVLRWNLQGEGTHFDPGQLLAGWDGALDFSFGSEGRHDQALDATVTIKQLAGQLRQRAVSGQGRLHLSPDKVVDGKLQLAMGQSHVAVQAEPGKRNDIRLDLDIASLGDWLPDAAGSMHGTLGLHGRLSALALQAKLQGKGLRWQQHKAGAISVDADVPNLASPGGRIEIQADKAEIAGLQFDRVNLDANGTEAHHSVTLTASGQQLKLQLAVAGSMPGQTWQGQVSRLDLQPQGIPEWRLVQAVPLSIGKQRMDMAELCLSAGDPRICVQAHQDQEGSLQASYRLKAVPLKLVSALLPDQSLPTSAEGLIAGQGDIRRSASGAVSGHAELHSEQGSVTWLDSPERPLLGWTGLRADADFHGQNQVIEVHGTLTQQGTLDGRLEISGAQHQLNGHLELDLDSLAFAELLNKDLANVQGALRGRFRIAGTLAAPEWSGQAQVSDFAAEVPVAGLKLTQGHFQASSRDAHTIELDGKMHSGKGTLELSGHFGLGSNAATALTIKGSRFEAANIPAARITLSPDLKLDSDANGLHFAGSVKIDSADVDAEKLPGAGTTQASPDVVVMDAPKKESTAAIPVSADITVELGDDTHLKGFGLDGRLQGQLAVQQRAGRAPIGQGQIQVDGTYHAYGQDLQIERGRLQFASTPLGNPGLNIRAVRKLNPNATVDDGQEVGLQIAGTAARPVLTVFSSPVMPQSDALSYLVTGKPLSAVKGGEGNLVSSAAQALGSATGDLLAKSVGSKLGVDDIGVSSNQALGGSAAFTVGKYLSPRLYLKYGVGLFDPGTVVTLRYILSARWNFEATQATDFSRASFNYRYER